MKRLLSRRQMALLKIRSTIDWIFDGDHEYRQPILCVWVFGIPLIVGQAFLWSNAGWSSGAEIGISLILGGVLAGAGAVVSFMIREDWT